MGKNLAEHPAFPLLAQPKSSAWKEGDFGLQTGAHFLSQAHAGAIDLQLMCFSYLNAASPDPAVETHLRSLAGGTMECVSHVVGIACVLKKPLSTGNIHITSMDLRRQPHIIPNYLSNPTDYVMMRELVRKGCALLNSASMTAVLGLPLNIDKGTTNSDEKLNAAIEANSASAYHFVGTCRMAPEGRGVLDRCTGRLVLLLQILVSFRQCRRRKSMLPAAMTAERIARSLRDVVDVRSGAKR